MSKANDFENVFNSIKFSTPKTICFETKKDGYVGCVKESYENNVIVYYQKEQYFESSKELKNYISSHCPNGECIGIDESKFEPKFNEIDIFDGNNVYSCTLTYWKRNKKYANDVMKIISDNIDHFTSPMRSSINKSTINKKELAQLLGITYSALYAWTSGTNRGFKSYPQLPALDMMANVFGISLIELLTINFKEINKNKTDSYSHEKLYVIESLHKTNALFLETVDNLSHLSNNRLLLISAFINALISEDEKINITLTTSKN